MPRLRIIVDGRKACTRCGEWKPFTAEFYGSQREYMLGHCRVCHGAASLARSKTGAERTAHRRHEAARRLRNPDLCRAQRRAANRKRYAEKHAEVRAYTNAWMKAHPEQRSAWTNAARARRAAAPGRYAASDVREIHEGQGGVCFYCAAPLGDYHVDHMTPLSRGGHNSPDNLCCACPTCNLRKGTATADEFIAANPRRRAA